MTAEQFNELIKVIASLSESSFPWIDFLANIFVALISAGIAALVAYKVAKLQITNSETQQKIQREAELKNQKQFMIDELKLNLSENILKSTTAANNHIYTLISLARKKLQLSEAKMYNYSDTLSEAVSINDSMLKQYREVQDYFSDLYTFIELFEIKENVINFDELTSNFTGFYCECIKANEFKKKFTEDSMDELSFNLETKEAELVDMIINIDKVVRKKQIELINSMKEN